MTEPLDVLIVAAGMITYDQLPPSVERAFRGMKSVHLKVRPIFHHLETRARTHVFLSMLGYYVEWHTRKALAPILFTEDDVETPCANRPPAVAGRGRSS